MEEKYQHYSVEDFAADPDFIGWVKRPDNQSNIFWKSWQQRYPEKHDLIQEARSLVNAVQFDAYPDIHSSIDEVWHRISVSNRLYQPSMAPTAVENSPSIKWWRWAAVLTGFLLLAGGILYSTRERTVEYHTAFGETRQLVLPDGSSVTLNANSSLRLGAWKTDREVWLKGEAFFQVEKKQTQSATPKAVKFIVHAGKVDVSVLGTKFTVSDHHTTQVVLNEGKIQLTHHQEKIEMMPGELVEVSADDKQLVKRVVNPVVYSSWADHEWILDGTTLKEVAKRLEDTYGMKVLIKNTPDPAVKVTGVVPTDNLEKLLTALSAVFEMNFKRKGNEIIIE